MFASKTFATAPMSASMSGPNTGLMAALFTTKSQRPSSATIVATDGSRDVGIGDRTLHRHTADAQRFDRCAGLGELVGLAGHDADVGTGRRAGFRNRAADPPGAARDQRRLAVDPQRRRRVDHR